MTDYADIQCDEMTCKTWPKSWQRFTLSFLARDTNGTRVWARKNRLLFTLDSSTLARISSFHILSLWLIIYSNWLWANFNLEKFISWCLKINGWFFRQKTTWLFGPIHLPHLRIRKFFYGQLESYGSVSTYGWLETYGSINFHDLIFFGSKCLKLPNSSRKVVKLRSKFF